MTVLFMYTYKHIVLVFIMIVNYYDLYYVNKYNIDKIINLIKTFTDSKITIRTFQRPFLELFNIHDIHVYLTGVHIL